MHHPVRAELIPPLLDKLGHDVPVIVDENSDGIWETAKRAWLSFDSRATHHLVLQDDIRVCNNLLDALPKILRFVHPLDSISLCSQIQATETARERNLSWLRTKRVQHGQALIQPTSQIADWIAWCDYYVRPEYRFDDGRLEMYLRDRDRWLWSTIPALVQHDDNGSVSKQVQNTEKTSESYDIDYYIGDNGDPFSIDWSNGVALPFTVPTHMRQPEKWALGIDVKNIGRNQIPEYALLDPEAIFVHYDVAMDNHRRKLYGR